MVAIVPAVLERETEPLLGRAIPALPPSMYVLEPGQYVPDSDEVVWDDGPIEDWGTLPL